jgi:hypothetical protein
VPAVGIFCGVVGLGASRSSPFHRPFDFFGLWSSLCDVHRWRRDSTTRRMTAAACCSEERDIASQNNHNSNSDNSSPQDSKEYLVPPGDCMSAFKYKKVRVPPKDLKLADIMQTIPKEVCRVDIIL